MLFNALKSNLTTIILLFILGASAGYATFIENDFGTQTARVFVYDALWYEIVLVLTCINMCAILYATKAYKHLVRFIFHFAFVVILVGAGLTRYFGVEGVMSIRQNSTQNTFLSSKNFLHVKINEEPIAQYPYEFSAKKQTFAHSFTYKNKTFSLNLKEQTFQKTNDGIKGSLGIILSYQNKTHNFKLPYTKNALGAPKSLFLDDLNITLSYGAKEIVLPFWIFLKNFSLTRYAGSNSPSSYSSKITLNDKRANTSFDTKIFMNNTLSYGGYKFFQTSYHLDEKGTIFSVNKDPGKNITYLGYGLLFLGLILNFFDKNSRFFQLCARVKSVQSLMLFVLLFLGQSLPLHAKSDYVENYLKEHANNSKIVANNFGSLITQSRMGRMKPLDTLNREIVYKLSGKSELFGMNPNQIVLGMFTRPEIWKKLNIIKIKSPKLKELLGVDKKQTHISFANLFYANEYKIDRYVNQAIRVMPAFRSTFEKDLISIDERLNIAFMVFQGSVLKIFPLENSPNNQWIDFKSFWAKATSKEAKKTRLHAQNFLNSTFNRSYNQGISHIKAIETYQKTYGKNVMPKPLKIQCELWLNNAKIFPRLTPFYLILGGVVFIWAFFSLFYPSLANKKVNYGVIVLVGLLFIFHSLGLILRWYVSGHAPMSDTYESIVYIAWSAIFAGVVFFRSSLFALSAALLLAGTFMFAAHLSHIDPEITNLVPVLKSFWLTIHVSIITASYGFLGIGAILGAIGLILLLLRDEKRVHFDKHIKNITDINEISLIVGLVLLVIGNFLGGVWANESWGRYWGWDPKETWAYVSIIAYTIVLHVRLIRPIYSPYLFNALSLLSFSSILMTYFGVNFYLAGMHSYATGDPVPIPTWVYVASGLVVALLALSWRKRHILKNYI